MLQLLLCELIILWRLDFITEFIVMHGLQSKSLLKCACNFALVNDLQRLCTSNLGVFVEDF